MDILLTNNHPGYTEPYLTFIKREQRYIKSLIKHRYMKTIKDNRFFIMRRPDGDFGTKKTYPYKLLMEGTKDYKQAIFIGYQPVLNFVEVFNFFFGK